VAEKEALLIWKTASEFNNQGFEIERSYNGVKFEKIGWVDASIYPNQLNEYLFIDNNLSPIGEFIYYRFKQLDFDGKFEYSEVKRLKLSDALGSVYIYPNPAENVLNITAEDFVSVRIIGLNGKTLLNNQSAKSIDLSGIPSGIYLAEIKTLRGTEFKKFLKN